MLEDSSMLIRDTYECKENRAAIEARQKAEAKESTERRNCTASSFLWNMGLRLDSEMNPTTANTELRSQLHDLESVVVTLLKKALTFGKVFVITNAETGWVERSAEVFSDCMSSRQKFVPGVMEVLKSVDILSARSTFETEHPDNPLRWKVCAFETQLKSFMSNGQCSSNILSFGDSHAEREAVRAATGGLSNNHTKSVKFAERPTIEQLKRQLELIVNCFHYLVGHTGDLDLQLTVSALPPPAAPTPSATPAPSAVPSEPKSDASPSMDTTSDAAPIHSASPASQPTSVAKPIHTAPTQSCGSEHHSSLSLPVCPRPAQTAGS